MYQQKVRRSVLHHRRLARSSHAMNCSGSPSAQRCDFAEWLTTDGQNVPVHKIFADEFGMNMGTLRNKGRALQGQRVVRIIERQRGRNLTICLAVSSAVGLVVEGMTQALFAGFIVGIAQLMQINDIPFVVVCDNVASHKNIPNLGDIKDL